MKVIVAVVVYNRIENIKRWLRCWAKCETEGAELVIIHNYANDLDMDILFELCDEAGVWYIARKNIGFDIGALQDVCRGRLTGFPTEWDFLLWCTDDTFPMRYDFIQQFIDKFQPGVGITAMKISPSVATHVRTTGFCIPRSVASRLQFPTDPVITKWQCFLFEHKGNKDTMTNQIRSMGLACVQVAPDVVSPMWDTGYWKRLNRYAEHEQYFPSGVFIGDKVVFVCIIYNQYPQIISSLICQTHQNWELILIHDGKNETGLKDQIPNDKRIKYIETDQRVGNWGHELRRWALDQLRLGKLSDADYVVITNADNYYTPVFVDYMLKGFKKTATAVATYCDAMTHSYKAWQTIPCKFERGYIDCGGVMVKRAVAAEVGWRDTETHSSDWTFFSDIAAKYSAKNFIPVRGNLFVHN